MHANERGDVSVSTAFFGHNAWANLKLLQFCERLSDEQLDTNAPGCFGSIRDTLVHIVGAEVGYDERVTGKLPGEPLAADRFPGFETLKHDACWASDELLELALSARADVMVRQRSPRPTIQYPLPSLLVQAVTHSTEHRAQVSAIITQLGIEPPDMSAWSYMRELGELHEWGEGQQGS